MCGHSVTVAPILMYQAWMWTWSSEISNNSDFQAIWHAEAAVAQSTSSTPCVEADDIWLVLSRSRPSTHFLPCGHSDSRVKFIWYPWISATWKCKVSWFGPPSFDTLVSVVTLFHDAALLSIWTIPHTYTWYRISAQLPTPIGSWGVAFFLLPLNSQYCSYTQLPP